MEHRLVVSEGRISLSLHWSFVGKDLQVVIEGGESHIGAVALCHAGETPMQPLQLPHHREAELVQTVARRLASALGNTVCVSAGIHYQDITQAEIITVLSLADRLTDQCLDYLLANR